ncbi:MAG: HPr family phosphocarrier protein [Clostridiaceae bacterium]|nr:HPr family phosphocarrier protein [Clostridiaceae bacterium]
MKTITVTIHDKEGLHARPAGILNKAAKGFTCSTKMAKDGQEADIKRIFAIMGLKIKCGDVLTITCDGEDEDAAIAAIGEVFQTL